MPWEIRRDRNKWCVHKEDGERIECHASEADAKAHLRALYASDAHEKAISDVDRRIDLLRQINRAYAELDELTADGGAAAAPTPDTAPEPDDAAPEPAPALVPEVSAQESKSLVTRLAEVFKNFTTRDDVGGGFKAFGDYWLAAWTNNYKDRDGEFFPQKAIDDYIWRVDHGLVPPPELWDSHIPGTRSGQADMVFRVGNFAMAVGTFDDTPNGQAAKAYYNSRRNKAEGMSHGFLYDQRAFKDNAYWQFNTFELSPLGAFNKAANPYATFEGVKAMSLTDEKKQRLETIFGKEQAELIIQQYEEKSKALDDLQVEYKDFAAVPEGDETEAVKSAADNANQTFTDLLPDLLAGHVEAIQAATEAVKAVKDARALLEAQQAEIAALRSELALAPRASQAKETTVDDAELRDELETKEAGSIGFNPFPGVNRGEHSNGR